MIINDQLMKIGFELVIACFKSPSHCYLPCCFL